MTKPPRVFLVGSADTRTLNSNVPSNKHQQITNPCHTSLYISQLGIQSEFLDLTELANCHEHIISNSTKAWLYLTGRELLGTSASHFAQIHNLANTIKRAGGEVIFDPKYRENKEDDKCSDRSIIRDFAATCTIVISSLSGEDALWGRSAAHRGTIATTTHASRWFAAGVRLVVFKCGVRGAEIHEPRVPVRHVAISHRVSAVDMLGAGDSFNAGLIAGIAKGKSLDYSTRMANTLAGVVMRCRGPVLPANRLSQLEFAYA